jgi:hypothetical protein
MSDPVARTLPQGAVEAAGTDGALQLRNSYKTGNRTVYSPIQRRGQSHTCESPGVVPEAGTSGGPASPQVD